MPTKTLEGGKSTVQIRYSVPAAVQVRVAGVGMRTLFNASRVVSPTNTGNGGGYTNVGYDAYAGKGQAMRLGMSMMRVIWGMIPMEGLLELL